MRRATFHKVSLSNVSIRIMEDVLRDAGIDSGPAFGAAALSPDIAESLEAKVSGVEELNFQRAFAALTAARPDLWVAAGLRYNLLTLNNIGLTMLSAPSLKDMLDVVHLGELEFTFSIFSSADAGRGEACLQMSLDDVPSDLKHFTVCRDVALATRAFDHIWGSAFPLTSVEIELPQAFAPLFSFIRAPLTFDAPSTRWIWSAELQDRRLPHSNELLYRSYLARSYKNIARLQPDEDIVERVARTLTGSFPAGLTLSEAAKDIGKSPRALQRALQAQNLQFRDLVKDARIRQAQHLLRMTSLPVSEISLQVGYADLSGFSHAFKRVTGTTPRHYRTHLQGKS